MPSPESPRCGEPSVPLILDEKQKPVNMLVKLYFHKIEAFKQLDSLTSQTTSVFLREINKVKKAWPVDVAIKKNLIKMSQWQAYKSITGVAESDKKLCFIVFVANGML